MKFSETKFEKVFLIELELCEDDRGFFTRIFCCDEFRKKELDHFFPQCNLSYNKIRGTLRGMHFQKHPYEETKIIHCMKGAIFDVIIDLRKNSPTYLQWESFVLSRDHPELLYIPKGFAHGFQTLEDETEIFYFMSQKYYPGFDRGIRWDDPLFQICWPLAISEISRKDQQYQNYKK